MLDMAEGIPLGTVRDGSHQSRQVRSVVVGRRQEATAAGGGEPGAP